MRPREVQAHRHGNRWEGHTPITTGKTECGNKLLEEHHTPNNEADGDTTETSEAHPKGADIVKNHKGMTSRDRPWRKVQEESTTVMTTGDATN